jgi:hypothetical protein
MKNEKRKPQEQVRWMEKRLTCCRRRRVDGGVMAGSARSAAWQWRPPSTWMGMKSGWAVRQGEAVAVAVAMAGPWPPTFLASCFIHFCSFLGRCCDALAANRPCQDLWHRGLCSLRQRCQVANYAEKFKLAKNRPYLTSFHSWPPVHWKRNLKMTPDWRECD